MLAGDWDNVGVGAVVSILSAPSPEVDQVVLDHPEIAHTYYPLEDHVARDPEHAALVTLFAPAPHRNIFHVLEFMGRHAQSDVR